MVLLLTAAAVAGATHAPAPPGPESGGRLPAATAAGRTAALADARTGGGAAADDPTPAPPPGPDQDRTQPAGATLAPTGTAAPAIPAAARTAIAQGVGGAAAESTTATTVAAAVLAATGDPTAAAPPSPTEVPTTAPAPTAAPTTAPVPTAEPTATPEPTATMPPTPTPSPTPSPTSPPAPLPATAEPTVTSEPTADPMPTVTREPTASPAPASTTPPTATAEPTPATATEATATATDSPTATPTPTPDPTPTPRPTTTPTPALPTQAPSLAVNEIPDQATVNGPIRYTFEVVARGATLPDFGLPPATGEWVALVVHVRNWTDAPATLAMDDIQLAIGPSGLAIGLDSGTSFIAGVIGLDPPYGAGDIVTLDPGGEERLALVFLVPPGATDATLLVGTAAVPLAGAIAASIGVEDLGEPPARPRLVRARVVEALDGQTVAVEIEGAPAEVRLLGVDAPTGSACWADEATAAAADLLPPGTAVWLERQRTDVDLRGRLMRDVWVEAADGELALVAAQLAAAGAIEVATPEPNTRFAAALAAAEAVAIAADAGRWGGCVTAGEGTAPVAFGSPSWGADLAGPVRGWRQG